jgi:ABC-2 type transport system permease protein
MLRGEKPQLLIQGDAIDPMTTGNALSALVQVAKSTFQQDLPGEMRVGQKEDDFELIIHRMFNPRGLLSLILFQVLWGRYSVPH